MPDRAQSDPRDNELSDGNNYETEARTASLGIVYKKTGMSASSLHRFMAQESDETASPSSGVQGVESKLAPKTPAG